MDGLKDLLTRHETIATAGMIEPDGTLKDGEFYWTCRRCRDIRSVRPFADGWTFSYSNRDGASIECARCVAAWPLYRAYLDDIAREQARVVDRIGRRIKWLYGMLSRIAPEDIQIGDDGKVYYDLNEDWGLLDEDAVAERIESLKSTLRTMATVDGKSIAAKKDRIFRLIKTSEASALRVRTAKSYQQWLSGDR